jgi:hypothetical protein
MEGYDGADGCKGSPVHAILDWVANKNQQLASRDAYPYRSAIRIRGIRIWF